MITEPSTPINQIQDIIPESIPLPDSKPSSNTKASNSEVSIPRNSQYINLQQLTHDLFVATNQQLNQNTPINTEEMAPDNTILRTVLSANLPADQKLRGQENWITWYSSILTLLRLFELEKFFLSDTNYSTITEPQKTVALIIIRQNLTEKPLSLVLTEKEPSVVFIILKASYEGSGPVLRQQLYLQFHQMKVENYKTTIQFISEFKDILIRLKDCGATIEDID